MLVSLLGAPIWAIILVQNMRQPIKSTFLIAPHTHGDDILTLFKYFKIEKQRKNIRFMTF